MNIRSCVLFFFMASGFTSILFCQIDYELLYLKGDHDRIINEASQKTGIEDYYWHALVLSKKGKLLSSCQVLGEGIESHPGDSKLELLLANLYYESGNFVQAKPILEKHSSSHEVFIRLIEILEFQNSYPEAIKLLEARLLSDSLNLALLIHLGDNYYQLDSSRTALAYYDKVYSLNPDDQATANKLASIFMKEKEYMRSIQICDEVLLKDSINRKFLRIKGSASFNNKDYSTSNSCFRKLYEMGDSGQFVLKHLGLGEIETYQYADGRKHLLSAYKYNPNVNEVCFALGRAFLNSRTPEIGLFFLERLDSLLLPDTAVLEAILMEKKSIYYTLDDFENALACFQQAYAYNPQAKYLFYMASMYEHRFNQPKLALEYYSRFLEDLPPPEKLSDNPDLEGQVRITMRSAAENSITELKEKLFFEGKLEEQ